MGDRRLHLSRAEALGVPQASLDSFAPEFRQGMAARAAELGDVGASAPAQLGRPLGTADVHVAISVHLAGQRPARSGRGACAPCARGAAGRRGDLAAGLLPAADRSDVVRVQGRDRPACDRRQRDPRHEPARAADQGRRVPARLSGRDRRGAADADAGGARPERHIHRLPKAAHARRRVPPVPAREGRRAGEERRCSARRWSVAGRAARHCRSSPDEDDRELGADPHRNNAFSYGDDPKGFKCPVGRPRATRQSARRVRR